MDGWMDVLKPQPTVQQLRTRDRVHPANQHDALMSPNRTEPEMLLPLDVALLSSAQICHPFTAQLPPLLGCQQERPSPAPQFVLPQR